MPDHVLMTILGTRAESTEYQLDGVACCARLAPIALFHLLGQKSQQPSKVMAFCTEKAQATYEVLQQELADRCPLELVPIPEEGDTKDAVGDFLQVFADAAPRQGALTVETTHGFRHYAMMMLLGAFYVSALREDLALRHVYYALFGDTGSPIIDLGQLLGLSHWIHATSTFSSTGSARPMAELIRAADTSQNAQSMARDLDGLSQFLADGLPLELGVQAGKFVTQRIKPLRKLVGQQHLPGLFSQELAHRIREELRYYALPTASKDKASVKLDRMELKRQIRLIDRLHEYGHQAAAIGLMREWVVSWAIWQTGNQDWLDERRPAETALNLLSRLCDEDATHLLSARQRELAEFWSNVRELRNLTAHHGMKRQEAFGKKVLAVEHAVWQFWQDCMRHLPEISLDMVDGVKHDRLVVSPLGHTPGVLFSTLRTCNPPATARDLCLVITSRAAVTRMDEALEEAGFAGEKHALVFDDPFAGLDEREDLLKQAAKFILGTRETHVNMTGGTTLMGLLAEEIAGKAREYQRLATRFALVDQRSPDAQRDQPFVVGKRIEIESTRHEVAE